MNNEVRCSICGRMVEASELTEFDGDRLCQGCLEEQTVICDRCGDRVWEEDSQSDSHRCLCESCYEHYYYHCTHCDRLIHQDDAYYFEDSDEPLCYACYCSESKTINEYNYKPEPYFYDLGSCDCYMGVELEIDDGGESSSKAEQILAVANAEDDHMYCKHDGSLENGFELVTHPMSICYHEKKMPWCNILAKARALGYVSHQAGTCGLHIHVNRDAFGRTVEEQETCIARVLYFFEKHWDELLKFSRRTQRQLERWANRYGLKENPKDILCEAKGKHSYNRYTCVNLTNDATIEFRMFRGTLKLNTLLATLQLIDRICDIAINLSDEVVKNMSWTTFVSGCTQKELVQYAYMGELAAQADRMANTPLSDDVLREILEELFPVDEHSTDRMKQNVQKAKDEFMICYFMPDIEKFRGTAWGAINAMSDMLTHNAPRRKAANYRANNWDRIIDGHQMMDQMTKLLAAAR